MDHSQHRLAQAYEIAKRCHANQQRDDGQPFITHIDCVLQILMKEFHIHDEQLLLIATLHDTLEDSDETTVDEIDRLFGKDVAEGVMLMTKIKGQDFGEYINHITAFNDVPNLIVVKLADRLHNLRTMEYRSQERIQRKCTETKKYLLPCAKKFDPRLEKEMMELIEELEERVRSFESIQ